MHGSLQKASRRNVKVMVSNSSREHFGSRSPLMLKANGEFTGLWKQQPAVEPYACDCLGILLAI